MKYISKYTTAAAVELEDANFPLCPDMPNWAMFYSWSIVGCINCLYQPVALFSGPPFAAMRLAITVRTCLYLTHHSHQHSHSQLVDPCWSSNNSFMCKASNFPHSSKISGHVRWWNLGFKMEIEFRDRKCPFLTNATPLFLTKLFGHWFSLWVWCCFLFWCLEPF